MPFHCFRFMTLGSRSQSQGKLCWIQLLLSIWRTDLATPKEPQVIGHVKNNWSQFRSLGDHLALAALVVSRGYLQTIWLEWQAVRIFPGLISAVGMENLRRLQGQNADWSPIYPGNWKVYLFILSTVSFYSIFLKYLSTVSIYSIYLKLSVYSINLQYLSTVHIYRTYLQLQCLSIYSIYLQYLSIDRSDPILSYPIESYPILSYPIYLYILSYLSIYPIYLSLSLYFGLFPPFLFFLFLVLFHFCLFFRKVDTAMQQSQNQNLHVWHTHAHKVHTEIPSFSMSLLFPFGFIVAACVFLIFPVSPAVSIG